MRRLEHDFVLIQSKKPYVVLETAEGVRICEVYAADPAVFKWEDRHYVVLPPLLTEDQQYHAYEIVSSATLPVLKKRSPWKKGTR